MRVPLLIFQPATLAANPMFARVGKPFRHMFGNLQLALKKAEIDIHAEAYIGGAIVSALTWALVFGIIMSFYFFFYKPDLVLAGAELALLPFFLFFLLHIYYPSIIANKISEDVNQNLLFALRDMLIQVSAGVSLFESIKNISRSGYGEFSRILRQVITRVESGTDMLKALEDVAFCTNSEYLKKIIWQLVTTLYAGANLSVALNSIVHMLVDYNRNLIKSYTAELNFLILIYLLVAAVVPTIGMTVMIVFSVFGALEVNEMMFLGIVGFSFVVQMMLAGYMLIKRPHLY
ncbi:hypothetical protein COT30_01050 [Candidatus Micrarchaeota archaeon CG08_land_8_20_14_0_20_49_17]|nr:MAG: hypothetical protein AUJ13_01510 [Candidatus Micrarchaeota archaeon CG1_02_49_24]PIU10101.1 MAG: hypothetical protein COT30_01050 [Candidatus Micrarchaeota archaeon CG08_land_8_20_14_0_20_49_17]PIU81289.1 MAG: hypothetical protein COS70_04870 [Candidatus Micrarchaeota archaeon CG06_land_8_20_14_3_00_50_6]HII54102.1 type II secretion system F family protein [Candidatus Micrarchaeota archaeon]